MRKYSWLGILLLVTMILGACQPAAPAATEAPAAPAAAQPTAAPAAAEPTAVPAVVEPTAAPAAEKVTLTIESWRNDDLKIWSDTIIPAFEKTHPDIHVVFAPSARLITTVC